MISREHLICLKPEEVVVGGCASGKKNDCSGTSHSILCCETEMTTHHCHWKYAKWGYSIRCDTREVVQGQCSSGKKADCRETSGFSGFNSTEDGLYTSSFWSGLYCCEVRHLSVNPLIENFDC